VTEDLDGAVEALVQGVLASPRDAVVETKALLQGAARRTAEQQWKAEREAQARVLRHLAEE
jgi:enoyl-CoA hydratase/carnithine racemase